MSGSFVTRKTPGLLVLRGRSSILPWASLLEEFSARCGQPGAMSWLEFFLRGQTARHKTPYLVLAFAPGVDPSAASPQSLQAQQIASATLTVEYCVCGLRTRAFVPDDIAGLRSVVAPADRRRAAATQAAAALLECGAHIAIVAYDAANCSATTPPQFAAGEAVDWAERTRTTSARLPLRSTFDETLAQMSKSTRTNLRYYRRRLVREQPVEFVSDARGQLTPETLRMLNGNSRYPIENEEFERRVAACSLPGGFLLGLRTAAGEWLSLMGGWRQNDTTVLHFQCNAGARERDSLSTVMRSFLIEHEVERGAREIVFYGGTPHHMQRAFVTVPVHDLIIRRRSWLAAFLLWLAPWGKAHRSPFGRANFLGETLSEGALQWHQSRPSAVKPTEHDASARRAGLRKPQPSR